MMVPVGNNFSVLHRIPKCDPSSVAEPSILDDELKNSRVLFAGVRQGTGFSCRTCTSATWNNFFLKFKSGFVSFSFQIAY